MSTESYGGITFTAASHGDLSPVPQAFSEGFSLDLGKTQVREADTDHTPVSSVLKAHTHAKGKDGSIKP